MTRDRNVCGKREFGVEFNEFKNTFKQGYNAQRFREEIGLAQATIDHVVVRVSELLEGERNGEWCYQEMHSHMTRLLSDSITKPLSRRAQKKEAVVEKGVRLTEDEIASQVGGGSRFRTETIFIISGISAVASYKKLRTILKTYLGTELEVFRSINPDIEDYEGLRRWHNWKNKIESRLAEAESLIAECRRFLEPSNIRNIRANQGLL